jgi:hypothetical protein
MNLHLVASAARKLVVEWLAGARGDHFIPGDVEELSDAELIARFCAIAARTGLELHTTHGRNPPRYEARWKSRLALSPAVRRTFIAPSETEAQLLACATLLTVFARTETPAA